jgi:hypothetical protein
MDSSQGWLDVNEFGKGLSAYVPAENNIERDNGSELVLRDRMYVLQDMGIGSSSCFPVITTSAGACMEMFPNHLRHSQA